jgi:hypothetical protein
LESSETHKFQNRYLFFVCILILQQILHFLIISFEFDSN